MQSVIRDKSLEPYEIHMDEYNYAVVLPTGRFNKDGVERYKNKSYHSTLRGAVLSIIKLKCVDKKGTMTLMEFVYQFEQVGEEIIKRLSI